MKTEIIPVIHMLNEEQVFKNVETCLECGIKKVFIINHNVSVKDLLSCARKVKEKHPTLWVGINILGVHLGHKLSYALPRIDALWCDETITTEQYYLWKTSDCKLFGGLAFKYQPQPSDLKSACDMAKVSTDVATTSGTGTGTPANLKKIEDIRKYLGEHPMAIASGVSVDNILDYAGIADYLLVATSITYFQNELIIKEKLSELILKLE